MFSGKRKHTLHQVRNLFIKTLTCRFSASSLPRVHEKKSSHDPPPPPQAQDVGTTSKFSWGRYGPCTNRPIVFPLQIEKRKSKNDSLSDFSFFNSKTKMNYKVVFRLLYTYWTKQIWNNEPLSIFHLFILCNINEKSGMFLRALWY